MLIRNIFLSCKVSIAKIRSLELHYIPNLSLLLINSCHLTYLDL